MPSLNAFSPFLNKSARSANSSSAAGCSASGAASSCVVSGAGVYSLGEHPANTDVPNIADKNNAIAIFFIITTSFYTILIL